MYRSRPARLAVACACLASLVLQMSAARSVESVAAVEPLMPSRAIATLNHYRQLAGLQPVKNPDWMNEASWKHSRYVVRNDFYFPVHAEDPDLPWYTPEGDLAGRYGSVMNSMFRLSHDREVVEGFLSVPFHALSMLDPYLAKAGWGDYLGDFLPSHVDGQYAATLYSWGSAYGRTVNFPVRLPGPGDTTYLSAFPGNEFPDPLHHCGYGAVQPGAPIYVLIKRNVRSAKNLVLRREGTQVPACAFHGDNFRGSTSDQQMTGRAILREYNAVVIMPKKKLESEKDYSVGITINGRRQSWSFSVGDVARPWIKIAPPVDPYYYPLDNDDVTGFSGTAAADTTAVQIGVGVQDAWDVQPDDPHGCRFWTGSEWKDNRCFNPIWLPAEGGSDWTYQHPVPLPVTHPEDPERLIVWVRARDEVGNWTKITYKEYETYEVKD